MRMSQKIMDKLQYTLAPTSKVYKAEFELVLEGIRLKIKEVFDELIDGDDVFMVSFDINQHTNEFNMLVDVLLPEVGKMEVSDLIDLIERSGNVNVSSNKMKVWTALINENISRGNDFNV